MTLPFQHSDLHADPALRGLAVQRQKNEYQAANLVTGIPTNELSAKFRIIDDSALKGSAEPGDAGQSALYERGLSTADGPYNQVWTDLTEGTFSCKWYKFENKVGDVDADQEKTSFGNDLLQVGASTVMSNALVAKENRVNTQLMSTAIYTNTAAATDEWDDAAPDILADFEAAKESCRIQAGISPMELTAVIPPDAFQALKGLAEIVDVVSGSSLLAAQQGQDDIWIEVVRNYIGIGKVVVPFAVDNTSRPGQATAGAYVWGTDNVFVGFLPDGADINSACREFHYTGAGQGSANAPQIFRVRNPADEFLRIRAKEATDLVARAAAGYIISNVLT